MTMGGDRGGASELSINKAWCYLIVALVVENLCFFFVKAGLEPGSYWYNIPVGFLCWNCSLVGCNVAFSVIDLSVGYAIWCAVGIVGQGLLGALYFGEQVSLTRLIALGLLMLGIVLLKIQEYFVDKNIPSPKFSTIRSPRVRVWDEEEITSAFSGFSSPPDVNGSQNFESEEFKIHLNSKTPTTSELFIDRIPSEVMPLFQTKHPRYNE